MTAIVVSLGLGFGLGALLTGVALTSVGIAWRGALERAADPYRSRFANAQRSFLQAARDGGSPVRVPTNQP